LSTDIDSIKDLRIKIASGFYPPTAIVRQTMTPLRKYGICLLVSVLAITLLLGGLLWWDIRHAPQLTANQLIAGREPSVLESGPLVLDVRSAAEFARGHVPNALNVPFFSYESLAAINAPKDRSVIVYCELGPRAAWARWMLRLAGFADVKHLHGHMAAWRDAKMPTQGDASTRQQ
jgi:rhodanese-related sulfurtransferase